MGVVSFLDENRDLVCGRYAGAVGRARSKFDLAALLDVNVCEWLCRMEARHGVSEWMRREFHNYLNGRFVAHCDGYTCALVSGFLGRYEVEETVTAFVGCGRVEIAVPDNAILRVCCGGGDYSVLLGEGARLHAYVVEGTRFDAGDYGDRVKVETIDPL